jgi:hypothetical protein
MSPYSKAIVGAVVAALTTFVASIQGRPEIENLGTVDWLIIIVSAVVAGLSVFAVPNKDPQGRHQDESTMPPGV